MPPKPSWRTLKPTRAVAELEAMRAGWRRAYPNQPWVLEPELARAKRRAELEAKIEREATRVGKHGPGQGRQLAMPRRCADTWPRSGWRSHRNA